jgi:hypothetical protein
MVARRAVTRPAGWIYCRVFIDYSAFGRRPWAYLAANEVLVFGVVGLVSGIRLVIGAIISWA